MAKVPVSRDVLVSQLKKMGYTDIEVGKGGQKKVIVYLEISKDIKKTRISNLQSIAAALSAGNVIATYDTSDKYGSTIGQVVVKSTEKYGDGELIVYVKPKGKTGAERPGVANEIMLEQSIIKYAREFSESGYITVEFRGGGKTMTVSKVVNADRKQADRAVGTGAKGDVIIISKPGGKERRVPISIKQENAGNWASSDSYWNPVGARILEYAVSKGLVRVTKVGTKTFRLDKEIYMDGLTTKEKETAIFGTDIVQLGGAIIKKTFNQHSFTWDEAKQKLIVDVDFIWKELTDIPATKLPALIVRNDQSRGNIPGYKGLRPVVVPKDRKSSSQIVIKKSDLNAPTTIKPKPKGKK
jgi:hypothetical protein